MATSHRKSSQISSKRFLARISHKFSRQVKRNVALDYSENAREHCQIDKARVFLEQDGVTDRSNWPRICEKCGLARISHKLSEYPNDLSHHLHRESVSPYQSDNGLELILDESRTTSLRLFRVRVRNMG